MELAPAGDGGDQGQQSDPPQRHPLASRLRQPRQQDQEDEHRRQRVAGVVGEQDWPVLEAERGRRGHEVGSQAEQPDQGERPVLRPAAPQSETGGQQCPDGERRPGHSPGVSQAGQEDVAYDAAVGEEVRDGVPVVLDEGAGDRPERPEARRGNGVSLSCQVPGVPEAPEQAGGHRPQHEAPQPREHEDSHPEREPDGESCLLGAHRHPCGGPRPDQQWCQPRVEGFEEERQGGEQQRQ